MKNVVLGDAGCEHGSRRGRSQRPKVLRGRADGIDRREWAYRTGLRPAEGETNDEAKGDTMGISPISAASLGQSVLAASNSTQLQQTLQTLQNSLTSGDLNGAQAAFNTLQSLNQNLETVSGSADSSNSQLSTDLTALGSALSAGNLSTAQSAFATVKNDLNSSNSPSQTNEASAASEAGQLVSQLLSSLNVNTPSETSGTADSTTSVLERVYGNSGSLNVQA